MLVSLMLSALISVVAVENEAGAPLKIFKQFDADGSGSLEVKEQEILATAIMESHKKDSGHADDNLGRKMIQKLDENGDGVIQYDEFKRQWSENAADHTDPKQQATVVFQYMDQDQSGDLDKGELKRLQEMLQKDTGNSNAKNSQAPQSIHSLLAVLDADGNNKVSRDEFVSGWASGEKHPDPKTQAKRIFRMLDKDNTGTLDSTEQASLKELIDEQFKKMGENTPGVRAALGLARIDRNQDGMIDMSEFEADFLGNTANTDAPDDAPADPAAHRKLMESLFPNSENVEYVSADGTKKKMSREDLLDKIEQQEEIMAALKGGVGGSGKMGPGGQGPFQAGALPKETSGTLKMDQVEKENPSLHRMILVARAAWDLVVTAGEPNGTMLAMSSKESDDEDGEEQPIVRQQVKPRKGPLTLKLDIDIRAQNASNTTVRSKGRHINKYELEVVRNPKYFAYPHIAVIGAWKVDASGARVANVSVPFPPAAEPNDVIKFLTNPAFRATLFVIGVCMCLSGIYLFKHEGTSGTDDEPDSQPQPSVVAATKSEKQD